MLIVREFIERRVPHYAAAYLGASWVVIEFTNFAEQRYLLSPYLTDLLLTMLLLFTPSVLLVAYFHGRKGRDRAPRLERVALPLNALIVALVLFSGFSNKELGAMTMKVAAEDEDGRPIQRIVPKTAFLSKLAVFRFDAPTGDALGDTLAATFPVALSIALQQDPFMEIRPWLYDARWMRIRLQRAGYEDGRGVPLMLWRELSREYDAPHFVTGQLERAGNTTRVTLKLHAAVTGATLQELHYEGTDLLQLVDSAAARLKDLLKVPVHQLPGYLGLPLREVATTSAPALRAYATAVDLITFGEDWSGALALLDRAVTLDSTFAAAFWLRGQAQASTSDPTSAAASFESALRHAYRLPEHVQFMLRTSYYEQQGDIQKQLALAELWTRFRPGDKQAHLSLTAARHAAGQQETAGASLRTAFALDTLDFDVASFLAYYAAIVEADTAAATGYARRALSLAPSDPMKLVQLAQVFSDVGLPKLEGELYEHALLLDPGHAVATWRLGVLATRIGDWADAETRLVEALRLSRAPQERAWVYMGQYQLARTRGQLRRAAGHLESFLDEQRMAAPPARWRRDRLAYGAWLYSRLGQGAHVLALADSMQGGQLAMGQAELARAVVYLERDSLERARQALDAAAERLVGDLALASVMARRGELLHRLGDHEGAVGAFGEAVRQDPTVIHADAARCLRELGRYAEARALLERGLARAPGSPQHHAELGRLLLATGDRSGALRHFRLAEDAWKDADPEFTPADSLRAALVTLRQAETRGR
jgi:tetratricopeptide (TPR) repeat protein